MADVLAQPAAEPTQRRWLECLGAITNFLSARSQLAVIPCLSRGVHVALGPQDPRAAYWMQLCMTLQSEFGLYIPSGLKEQALLCGDRGWQGLARDLWQLRGQFVALNDTADAATRRVEGEVAGTERFRLQTFCRFRPPSHAKAKGSGAGAPTVALPLHQRIALLRQAHPELSQKEVLQHAIPQAAATLETGEAHGADVEEEDAGEGKGRGTGAGDGFTAAVQEVVPGAGGTVLAVAPGCGFREFEFGHVFNSEASQRDLYEQCGLRLVSDALNGLNGALIVYGQTSSGKTHTMFGPMEAFASAAGDGDDSQQVAAPLGEQRGLAPRVAEAVLHALAERRRAGFHVELGVSYVEIFGEEVTNLLSDVPANVHRGAAARLAHRHVLEGNLEVAVEDSAVLAELLARGEQRKRRAATAMNQRSTRAHTILVLRLRQHHQDAADRTIESTLFLADLGGSERVSKSHANEGIRAPGAVDINADGEQVRISWADYYRHRERITETSHINKGLLALKRCIAALHTKQQFKCPVKRKALRVPFRDSKLTAVLEPALGGRARAAIVVCCNSDDVHAEETVQTLRFSDLCSRVKYEHQKSAEHAGAAAAQLLRSLDAQIAEVEAEIRQKERMEWRSRVRTDRLGQNQAPTTRVLAAEEMELGGYGAVEILPDSGEGPTEQVEHEVWGEVAVGAEEERARYEVLLERRRRLLGA